MTTPEQQPHEGLAHQVARMFVQRSGWYSTKLHLALISMVVLVGSWATLTLEQRAAAFPVLVGGILAAASIYSGSRVMESYAQRPPAGGPP